MGGKFPAIFHSPRRFFRALTCKFQQTLEFSGVFGFFYRRKKYGPGEARTYILWIRNPPLYQCATITWLWEDVN